MGVILSCFICADLICNNRKHTKYIISAKQQDVEPIKFSKVQNQLMEWDGEMTNPYAPWDSKLVKIILNVN
jgi:hypothetical protein